MGEAKQRAITRPKQILLMVSSEKLLIIIQVESRTDRIGLVSAQMSVSTLKLGSSAQTVLIILKNSMSQAASRGGRFEILVRLGTGRGSQ